MRIDPDYKFNQKLSQRQWLNANPDYWKAYRKRKPEKTKRNRILQAIRNRRARSHQKDEKLDDLLIAKMDASQGDNFEVLGRFWMVPVIAKMDALKVHILKIPTIYP
jgi:hypothetical protein